MINKDVIKDYLLKGNFGLERETLRTTTDGFMSSTPHPFDPKDKEVERDFCEEQVEIITPVCKSIEELYSTLNRIHHKVAGPLEKLPTGPEYLWPFSNAPYIKRQADIPVAEFYGDLADKTAYRKYLAIKYGKRKMIFSGIHYNFSFDKEMLKKSWDGEGELQDYIDQVYLNLAAGLMQYSWLIVYLTSASPLYDESLEWDEHVGRTSFDHYGSRRNSEIGYWNYFVPFLNYDSVHEYVDSIVNYVDEGLIGASSEIYIPIRLKPRGINTVENLKNTGIDHIELRMLDLNPLTKLNIFKEDIYFIHFFVLYISTFYHRPYNKYRQVRSIVNHKRAAKFESDEIFMLYGDDEVPVKVAVQSLLDHMREFYHDLGVNEADEYLDYQERKLQSEDNRYCKQVFDLYQDNYVMKGVQTAIKYAKEDK